MEELVVVIGERAGWRVTEVAAVFATGADGWSALVRPLATTMGRVTRLHVAIILGGVARYTRVAFSAAEAVKIAESQVHHRNA